MTSGWTVVVPVKAPATAKSRLGLPDHERVRLARAFALDTVAAVRACPTVARTVVVTDDAALADELRARGAVVLEQSLGLNEAVTEATQGRVGPVAAVPADLPALTAPTLAAALAAAGRHRRVVVADRHAAGTVLLTSAVAGDLRPRFGPDSLRRHLASGAVELDSPDWPDLRCDVDTVDDLTVAAALGVGPATTAALRCPGSVATGSVRLVQATVSTFDPDTRCGTVLLDDGVELPFDAAAVAAGRMRLLRFGQRVRIRTEGDGPDQRVAALILATLADPT